MFLRNTEPVNTWTVNPEVHVEFATKAERERETRAEVKRQIAENVEVIRDMRGEKRKVAPLVTCAYENTKSHFTSSLPSLPHDDGKRISARACAQVTSGATPPDASSREPPVDNPEPVPVAEMPEPVPAIGPRFNPWLDGGEPDPDPDPDPDPEPEPDPPWARIDPVLVHAAQENSIFRIMRRPKSLSDL